MHVLKAGRLYAQDLYVPNIPVIYLILRKTAMKTNQIHVTSSFPWLSLTAGLRGSEMSSVVDISGNR